MLILLALMWTAHAGDGFERQVFTSAAGVKVPYRLLLPAGYDPKKTYPMIVMLHGKGERGSDNAKQLGNGIETFATPALHAKLPAIVVVPQCPEDDKWTTMSSTFAAGQQKLLPYPTPISRAALELVADLQKRHGVDGKRTSILGISMGAFGAMDWLARKPDMFGAVVAMSGGGDIDQAATLNRARVWFLHGDKDSVVTVDQSLKVAAAMRKAGGDPKVTVIPGRDHGPWDDLTTRPDVLKWLLGEPPAPIMVASPKDAPTAER